MLKIWKPIVFLIILGLVIVLFAIWIMSIIGFFFVSPYSSFLFPGKNFIAIFGFLCVFVVIGVPFLAVVFRCARLLLGRRVIASNWLAGMWTFFTIGIISLFALASFTGRQFSEGREESLALSIENLNQGDTLHLDLTRNLSQDAIVQFGNVILSDLKLHDGNVRVDLRRSKNGKFELEQRVYSRGETTEEAARLASEIRYQVEQKDGRLIFPEGFIIERGGKWRAQEVSLTLWIPEGQLITLDRHFSRILDDVDAAEYRLTPHWHENRVWKMGLEGLFCTDCPESKVGDEKFELIGFNQLQIEGEMKVILDQGDFDVRVTGKEVYTREIEVIKTGEILTVNANYEDPGSPVRLYITLPNLKTLDLDDTDDVKISGFSQPTLSIKCNGHHDVKAYINIDSLELQQRGRSEIDLRGSGKYIKAKLEDRSRLDSEHYPVQVADITTLNSSRAALSVSDTLRQNAPTGDHRITSDQDPKVVIDSQ